MRHPEIMALLLLVFGSAVCAQEFLKAGPTGSKAPALEPLVVEKELKRIEIDAPGEFFESNAHYVLTRDITAPRTALAFGKPWSKRVANCVIDLNGHTVTYNDEGYKPDYKSVCAGVVVFGPGPVVLRDGSIVQGKGRDAGCHGLNLYGARADVYALAIRVYGAGCSGIARAGGGKGGRVHDSYIEVHGTTVTRWSGAPTGISLSYSGPAWEIYNNTVVGGHRSISVAANARKNHETAAKIHHNRLAPQRTAGVKAPHAIFIYTAEKNEIYENLIDAIDARGINVQMSSKNNVVRNNLVAARYARDARGAKGYIENRCYGYWERSGGDTNNKVIDNIFIVNNATKGDATSSTIGLLVGTGVNYPEPIKTGEYRGNVVLCRHAEAKARVSGMLFKRCAAGVRVDSNRIIARTIGIDVAEGSEGVKIRNNVVLKPGDAGMEWRPLGGKGLRACAMEGNQSLSLPKDEEAPAAPTGLVALERPGAVELRWRRNTEIDLEGYRIRRNGQPVAMPLRGAPFWVDRSVTLGKASTYTVSAVDLSGNESKASTRVSVTVPVK